MSLDKSVADVISRLDRRNEKHYEESFAHGFISPESLRSNFEKSRVHALHNRLLEPLTPLIQAFPTAQWLTVGDGDYASQAHYLKSRGLSVTATDIDARFVQYTKDCGLIDKAEAQNVERLSYADNSFDFTLAKNTLHHLARPFLGVYEMLRVSRLGIVIIEPQDPKFNENLSAQADGAMEELQALIYNNKDFFFEKSGNYIYRLSSRELEKLALGLGRRKIAFRGINEIDSSGFGDIDNDHNAYQRLIQALSLQDFFAIKGQRRFNVLMSIIFTASSLPPGVEEALAQHGWEVRTLPENPYL